MTRAVAELVLLDDRFATPPGMVAESRRVTANIERVANLFITKTVWATLPAGTAVMQYTFLPRHLTIIDTLASDVPSGLPAVPRGGRGDLWGLTAARIDTDC